MFTTHLLPSCFLVPVGEVTPGRFLPVYLQEDVEVMSLQLLLAVPLSEFSSILLKIFV
jgi:hypothetical protein